eukprot:1509674-Pyramimonas_sp.AAC.1
MEMPELGLLPELGLQNYSYSATCPEMMMSSLMQLELQISYIDVLYSNRKKMIWSALLKYLAS